MSKSINQTSHWQLCTAVLLGAAVIMLPDMVYALSVANTKMENALCTVVAYIQGGTGKALATIAITVIGIGALLGKVSWGMAMLVAVGIAVIYGAGTMAGILAGDGDNCNPHGTLKIDGKINPSALP